MRIEKRLKQLADENPNYSLLWAQWEFDKKLLTRALNTISRDFPHYSLHDASHSTTIINQIEKIIAPDINRLSATDCWLLLESCYWHDAGMIITNEEKKLLLSSDSFKIHLEQLAHSQHELSSYAKMLIHPIDGRRLENSLLENNALTFLIADYYRILHAERSGGHVLNPMGIKISSPRTALIPQRFFNFVAEIVQCHGKNRTEILKLAQQNDGMDANDYSHPRYIAALLRIGDLLDIDDGRFCPTLLANIGELPPSSLDHQHKHASIKHLLINHEVIDIKAECVEYGGYRTQKAWFDYIQEEFDYQKRVWNKIVPESSYRALPTIENLDCSIKGYLAINGRVPSISLDSKRVYNYITGAQLYSEKYPFVRELIQNALDATYYKCWEELTENTIISEFDNDKLREVFEAKLSEQEIQVRLEDSNTQLPIINNEPDSIIYKFSVSDNATGMSIEDLAKLLNVGSESITQRKTALGVMPDWAKPSGFFGIGFQTVLKLCDRVVITTKKVDHPCYELEVTKDVNESYEISLKNNISIKKNGTQVSAYFKAPSIPRSVSSVGFDILHEFDPLIDDKLIVVPEYIKHEIHKNFDLSPVKIIFNNAYNDNRANNQADDYEWTSDYKVGADFNLFINEDLSSDINFMYKGVGFESNFSTQGIAGLINIFSKDAGYWLMMDRKKGRNDKVYELGSMIQDIAINNFQKIKKNSPNKTAADFFGFAVLNNNDCNQWLEYPILGKKIKEYLFEEVPLFISTNNPQGAEIGIHCLDVTAVAFDYLLKIIDKLEISCDIRFFKSSEFDVHGHKRITEIHEVHFKDDKKKSLSIEPGIIQRQLNPKKMGIRGRIAVPLYDIKYEKISIDAKYLPMWVSKETFYSDLCGKYLFLPFRNSPDAIFKFDDMDDISIIFNFCKKNNLTLLEEHEFKNLYKSFWKDLDSTS